MAMSRSFGAHAVDDAPADRDRRPRSAVSSPAMMVSSVDLPQPDGPTSTMNSPLSISRSMPFSTSDRAEALRQVADGQRRHVSSII